MSKHTHTRTHVCVHTHVLKPTSTKESCLLSTKGKDSWELKRKWRGEVQALFELGKRKDAGEWVGFSELCPASW